MTKLSKTQDARMTEIQTQISDAAEFIEELATDAEIYFDGKSESWQGCERGESYSSWKDQLRSIADVIGAARDELENLTTAPE